MKSGRVSPMTKNEALPNRMARASRARYMRRQYSMQISFIEDEQIVERMVKISNRGSLLTRVLRFSAKFCKPRRIASESLFAGGRFQRGDMRGRQSLARCGWRVTCQLRGW